MKRIKLALLALILLSLLAAAADTNNFIFTQSVKQYFGKKGPSSIFGSDLSTDIVFPLALAMSAKYDFHIANGWKISTGAGLEVGRSYFLLAELGAKKYLDDEVYIGAAYIAPLVVGNNIIASGSTSEIRQTGPLSWGTWSYREKYEMFNYKPTFSLFAGKEFGDWVIELGYRKVTYELRHTTQDGDYGQIGYQKSIYTNDYSADEFSFSLGLIF
jgi:hypothetical protein